MRCLSCEKWSFSHLCQRCQKEFIVPNPEIRVLDNGLKVLSFFPYDEIDFLLKTKHTDLGYYIYTLLAKKTLLAFKEAFKYDHHLSIIPIDDRAPFGYAHTAIMAKSMKSKQLHPTYHALQSQNSISYSGKPLSFRQANSRDFKLLKPPKHDVLLIDDIVTTGETLTQAVNLLDSKNIETIMAVVLADANR